MHSPAYWVSNEVDNCLIEFPGPCEGHAPFDHEVGCSDDDGKDGPRVVGVGEVAEPEGEGEEVAVELGHVFQQHVVLALREGGAGEGEGRGGRRPEGRGREGEGGGGRGRGRRREGGRGRRREGERGGRRGGRGGGEEGGEGGEEGGEGGKEEGGGRKEGKTGRGGEGWKVGQGEEGKGEGERKGKGREKRGRGGRETGQERREGRRKEGRGEGKKRIHNEFSIDARFRHHSDPVWRPYLLPAGEDDQETGSHHSLQRHGRKTDDVICREIHNNFKQLV